MINYHYIELEQNTGIWDFWLRGSKWKRSQAGWFLQIHSSFSRLLWLFEVLYFHTDCEIMCCSSVKNTVVSLIGIALDLSIALDSILIFTLLILLIHEHGIVLHLFVSSLISFISAEGHFYVSIKFLCRRGINILEEKEPPTLIWIIGMN